MYLVFDKDAIERKIIPHLPVSERGFAPQVPLYEIVNAILYKLVTGVQWAYLPLSSADMDGSHTPAVRGGEAVGYQGRKKRRTTNAVYLTDRQDLPLAMSEPVSGNHNHLFDIEVVFDGIMRSLRRAKIPTQGLFVNADAGFDSKNLREMCEREGVVANIPNNKRNGDTYCYYFNEVLYKINIQSNGRTPGWTVSGLCSTGLTPP